MDIKLSTVSTKRGRSGKSEEIKAMKKEVTYVAVNPSQSPVESFNKNLNTVKEQVEFECFTTEQQGFAEEICFIITEINKLVPCAKVKIGGENYSADMVQAVYHRLTHEHVMLVMDNFSRIRYEIKHKKTYLRTALYNSVFELNAHWENQYNATQGS